MFAFYPTEFDRKNTLWTGILMSNLLGTLVDKKILTEKEAIKIVEDANKALEDFNAEELKKYEKFMDKKK